MKYVMALLLLAVFAGHAAAQTWSGLGADNNWSTGANWVGGVAPASGNATQVTFGGGSPRLSPVLDAPWTINQLTLAIGHPGYTFNGQALTFAGAAPQLTVLGLTTPGTTFTNPIVLTGTLDVRNSGIVAFAGGISGTGPFVIGGLGFASISGNNPFTGGLTVGGAQAFQLRGASLQGPVTVESAGLLSGGGTVAGAVTVTGLPSGGLAPSPQHGTLRTGNLTNSGYLAVTIGGATQGTQYSHLDVTGAVVLGNPALNLFGSFVPPEGAVFTIITNDGTDPVAGTFFSLPEGSTVIFNGVRLVVSYVGGTGNDVTLAAVGLPIGSEQAPTLSQWALLLLAALLGVVGARQLSARSPGR